MPDILPDEAALFRRMEETAHRLFPLYGYAEIRTPLFEETRLFVRGIGEDTEIVQKEMYTFAGEAGEGPDEGAGITLRPEGTAPVVRAVIEHNLLKKRSFWKLYYVGPMFRKERPQAGRLRQFSQVGAEAIGSYEPVVDAESILLASRFLREVGLRGICVKLNSLGCGRCRPKYREALRAALEPRRVELCRDCQARLDRNVFRILDCKQEGCRTVARQAPAMRDFLDRDCREHLEAVEAALRSAGQEFIRDDHLVRGFDYYTRTLFEISHPSLGARDAVCGGGRYDHLVEELGGPPAGCVGFAVGVVPTLLALQRTGAAQAAPQAPAVYVAAVNDEVRPECFRIALELREAEVSAELDLERRSLKAQMRAANRLGVRYVLVVGPDELAEGRVTLREMEASREERLTLAQVLKRLRGE